MDEVDDGLTCGYLPIAAFSHSEPTAIGVLDLDVSMRPKAPDGGSFAAGNERDGLLLVRLHEEPLAVVHADRPRTGSDLAELRSGADLAELVWRFCGDAIRCHARRHGCVSLTDGPQMLSALLGTTGSCVAGAVARVDASAAVIVCTAGREVQLERCVRSLLSQRRADLEVIVVDNRPARRGAWPTLAPLMADDKRLRYVAEPRPGLSVARNRGVSESEADVVAFTDDDVVADPGWLDWLLQPFREPAVGVSCGMVLPLALRNESQKLFERYGGFSKGLQRRSYDLALGQAPGRLLYPFINGVVGVGNSMAFRRDELVAGGGFDPALGAGSPGRAGEETCAFSSAILRGARVVYEPRALCWHEHREDSDALRGQVYGYGVSVGAILTRALVSDPRFCATAARALPLALNARRRMPKRSTATARRALDAGGRPAHLGRARIEGIVHGPLRYVQGVRRARRLRLERVIHGG
jgi:GT2 family glycosyltransferase